ncbi:FecCD family ABC transporter permease [Paenibacillus pinistramenti]|uniref:FecCD family ABC transporter permease n=1 Tax=Paenibacillus pinistramenti TaxID=1768003 RepID=UPI001109BD40|nr:iron ABC transporter permease [Paenibacillus pinistramenti]
MIEHTFAEIHNVRQKRTFKIVVMLSLILAVIFLISLNTGTMRLTPEQVWAVLTGEGSQKQQTVLFRLRLPRMIIAILVGAGLAVSGAVLQGISKNALADPGILGINSGANLVVLLIVITAPASIFANPFLLPAGALLGSCCTAAIIFAMSYKKGRGLHPSRMLLIGIAVAAALSAISAILTLKLNPMEYDMVYEFSLGSLYGGDWDFVLSLLPWILGVLPFVIYKSHILNILHLNESAGVSLGYSVEKERFYLLLAALALAASSSAIGGGIGFVGLMGPHMARKLVGPKHQFMLPAAALLGAILVIAGDTVARSILKNTELPAGVVISMLGAPYFLYLLLKSR